MGTLPSNAELQLHVAEAKTFLVTMIELVQVETDAWASELKASLDAIEQRARSQQAQEERRLTESRAAQSKMRVHVGEGGPKGVWNVFVDGVDYGTRRGKMAVLDVSPGPHTVRVSDGERIKEDAVDVPPGVVVDCMFAFEGEEQGESGGAVV